jgi:hypothetical protein
MWNSKPPIRRLMYSVTQIGFYFVKKPPMKIPLLPTLQERFTVTQSGSADIKDHIKRAKHKQWFPSDGC